MTETKRIINQAPDNSELSIARDIVEGINKFIFCIEEDRFYLFRDGYWQPIHQLEILDYINESVRITHLTLNVTRNVIERLKQIVKIRLDKLNTRSLINLNNYMINVNDGSIYPHAMEYFSTIKLKYNYEENSRCDLWKETLNGIFEGDKDKINILQEYMGYCLTRDVSREKSLLLLGESRSGKSTILETINSLLGDENTSSVALEYLSNPQYTPMLINKMLNIDWDVSGDAQKFEANFKIITSGEPVSVNQKFVATFKFRPFCKLILAANKFPRITDHSSAFYKRLILLPCNRVFESHEQDIQLKQKLKEELPGIFNWAMWGLHRLEIRGGFNIDKKFMTDALEELREESNPVEVFFKENIVTDVTGVYEIEKKDLYMKYKNWCIDNGNAPMANNKFGATVYAKYSKYTPKTTSNAATGKRVWKNLRWINAPFKGEPIEY